MGVREAVYFYKKASQITSREVLPEMKEAELSETNEIT